MYGIYGCTEILCTGIYDSDIIKNVKCVCVCVYSCYIYLVKISVLLRPSHDKCKRKQRCLTDRRRSAPIMRCATWKVLCLALLLAAVSGIQLVMYWRTHCTLTSQRLRHELSRRDDATKELIKHVKTKFYAQDQQYAVAKQRIVDLEQEIKKWKSGAYSTGPLDKSLKQKHSTKMINGESYNLGKSSFGGWTFDTSRIGSASIIYSVGIAMDAAWSKYLMKRYHCRVYAFDATPKVARHIKADQLLSNHPNFTFTRENLGVSRDKVQYTMPPDPDEVSLRLLNLGAETRHEIRGAIITLPVNTLRNWVQNFEHSQIDILKVNIEGAEFGVIKDWVAKGTCRFFKQLLIEFHDRYFRYPDKLRKQAINSLEEAGFEIYFHEDKRYTFLRTD